jgi:hypothetical protein
MPYAYALASNATWRVASSSERVELLSARVMYHQLVRVGRPFPAMFVVWRQNCPWVHLRRFSSGSRLTRYQPHSCKMASAKGAGRVPA